MQPQYMNKHKKLSFKFYNRGLMNELYRVESKFNPGGPSQNWVWFRLKIIDIFGQVNGFGSNFTRYIWDATHF